MTYLIHCTYLIIFITFIVSSSQNLTGLGGKEAASSLMQLASSLDHIYETDGSLGGSSQTLHAVKPIDSIQLILSEDEVLRELGIIKKNLDVSIRDLVRSFRSLGIISKEVESNEFLAEHDKAAVSPKRKSMTTIPLVHSRSWPLSLSDSGKLFVVDEVVRIMKLVTKMDLNELIKGEACRDIMSSLHSLLIDYRFETVSDPRVEDLLSKVIFIFSPCARFVEFYVSHNQLTTIDCKCLIQIICILCSKNMSQMPNYPVSKPTRLQIALFLQRNLWCQEQEL